MYPIHHMTFKIFLWISSFEIWYLLFIYAFVHAICVCVFLCEKLQDWFSDNLMLNILPLNWYFKTCLLFYKFQRVSVEALMKRKTISLSTVSFTSLFPDLHFVHFILLSKSSNSIFLLVPLALSILTDSLFFFFKKL